MGLARSRRFSVGWVLALTISVLPGLAAHGQPAGESAAAMDARLEAAAVTRVGPSYLYPAHGSTPGLVNPDITQANIDQTICNPQWSTKSIRPHACIPGGPRDGLPASQCGLP